MQERYVIYHTVGVCPESQEFETIRVKFVRNPPPYRGRPRYSPVEYTCSRAEGSGCAARGEDGGSCPVFKNVSSRLA